MCRWPARLTGRSWAEARLRQKGIRLPQADYDMRTALMVAAADGSLAAVRPLR